MCEWKKEYHNISVAYEEKIVRIKNNSALTDFLDDPKTKGSLMLADHILKTYSQMFGYPLKISRDSLAIEILGHVYLDHFADLAKMLKSSPLKALLQEMKSRTEVIDCGERSVDSNRYVWDDLEPYKKTIYALCGKHA